MSGLTIQQPTNCIRWPIYGSKERSKNYLGDQRTPESPKAVHSLHVWSILVSDYRTGEPINLIPSSRVVLVSPIRCGPGRSKRWDYFSSKAWDRYGPVVWPDAVQKVWNYLLFLKCLLMFQFQLDFHTCVSATKTLVCSILEASSYFRWTFGANRRAKHLLRSKECAIDSRTSNHNPFLD